MADSTSIEVSSSALHTDLRVLIVDTPTIECRVRRWAHASVRVLLRIIGRLVTWLFVTEPIDTREVHAVAVAV